MRATLTALWGEVRKGLLISWTYKANTLVSLFTLGFIFVGIAFFMGGGELDPERIASSMVGYLVWMYVVQAISDLTYGLRGEISAGTLEQLEMSPAPAGLLLIGRVITNFTITTLQVALMATVMRFLFDVRVSWRVEALPALLLTLVGVLGFGYLLAGAMLVFKQVESFSNLMNNALAFLNGTFLPVGAMPGWLAGISMSLPSTLGIVVIRGILLQDKTLADTWREGSLGWLAINAGIYLIVGVVVFGICERVAKNRGSLGQY